MCNWNTFLRVALSMGFPTARTYSPVGGNALSRIGGFVSVVIDHRLALAIAASAHEVPLPVQPYDPRATAWMEGIPLRSSIYRSRGWAKAMISPIWRYLKMIAALSTKTEPPAEKSEPRHGFSGIETNTVRIARLRLLMIAAKVVTDSNKDKVRYFGPGQSNAGIDVFPKKYSIRKDHKPNHGPIACRPSRLENC
jgi:hypothetical protein